MSVGVLGLSADEVQVATADLDVPSGHLDRLIALLAPSERARADRFRFARDRARYIAAHGVLRQLLSHYLDVAPGDVEFKTLEHGKPILGEGAAMIDLHFNLAHSGSRAAFAFAIGRGVGVDIERVRDIGDLEDLADRYFAPEEVAELRELTETDQILGFYNCWTRKEALVKSTGAGLNTPLDRFAVSLRPGEAPRLLAVAPELAALEAFRLETFDAGPGFVGAVAFSGPGHVVECGYADLFK